MTAREIIAALADLSSADLRHVIAQAGDSVADIAQGSGRSPDQWRAALTAAGVICLRPIAECGLADRDAIVAERYVEGLTMAQIGRELGVSPQWAHALAERLIQAGVILRRPRMGPERSPEERARIAALLRQRAAAGKAQHWPERNARVLKLVRQGLSYTLAGRGVGISRGAVAGIVDRAARRGTPTDERGGLQ